MERCALQILNIVHSLESIHRQDMIPSPFILRTDPQLSNALDDLLDNGYLEVVWTGFDPMAPANSNKLGSACNPGMESLFITSTGFEALVRERKVQL